jgi:hypothetical protein
VNLKSLIVLIVFAISASQAFSSTSNGKYFDRAIFVIFENTNYASAIKQPFFKQLADSGAHFSNFMAITHPSQGNYVALTSGALNGVTGDGKIDLNVANVADLLEAKSLTWKVYAEDYPGGCFTGSSKGNYARKHNPFISYVNIQKNPARCANIVDATQFDTDARNGTLPNYVFYVPSEKNDGHDTGVSYADKWYSGKFSSYLNDPSFMAGTVLISTFDESGASSKNQIYTSIVGPSVKPGVVTTALNLYSLLNLIEDNWDLGSLGKSDATASPVPMIWQ